MEAGGKVRTLFVTDLDGTLMRDDKTISDLSVTVLNRLIKQGVCLTYATARSFSSASEITKDIALELPVITRNGTVLVDPRTGEELEIAVFGKAELTAIRQCLKGISLPGFSTTYLDGQERKIYVKGRMNEGFRHYLEAHREDGRLCMTEAEEALYGGKVCYFTFIADRRELEPLHERIMGYPELNCVFQQDKYRPEYWLEICPDKATKAQAIQRVKESCGCDRVVVFGDSLNDVSMFRMADASYAVRNGMEELKQIATGIIGENNADGVARWLEQFGASPWRDQ